MRIIADIIESEGERVSPHSKYYVWEDKLFEPVYYKDKKCKTYKAITDINKINKVMNRKKQSELIPTVSSVYNFKQKRGNKSQANRFEILDL